MNRRQFVHYTAIGLGSLSLQPDLLRSGTRQLSSVDGQRLNVHIQQLAAFGRLSSGGISRVAFSEADLAARVFVQDLMQSAQLSVTVDAAGNIIGRREGTASDLPALMLGSHIDSVPHGGNFDGPVGSLGAIEVAHSLADHDIALRHPIEVAVFQNEEGGKTGSRAMSGELDLAELDLVTHSGHSIGDGIGILGGDPRRLETARKQKGDIAAYLELHVEQGGLLEAERIDIGVVEGIVGIKRWTVSISGFANHAGTTPMTDRRDALLAAARFVETVNRVVTSIDGRQVGTVGQLEVSPGAPNVIPGHVTLSLEIRDLDMEKINFVFETIRTDTDALAKATGVSFEFEQFYVSRAAPTDERIRGSIDDAAAQLNLSSLRMPSGAGHDAQSIALLAPIGMIFIPSVGGISHSPKEFSQPRDVTNGANVLLHTLVELDAAFD
jgi:N-carbamoyl-L-amino-acid hydrolase